MKSSHTSTTSPRTRAYAKAHATKAETDATSGIAEALPATLVATPAPLATTAAPAPKTNGTNVVFIALPPANAHFPVPPQNSVARPGEDYRGTQPKKAELATLAAAIDDLNRFASQYTQVLGATAPPLEHVLQLFQAGSQWSASRIATASWDVYARGQEGLAWGGIRAVMDTLRPAFDLAVKGNRSLATMLPGLTSLLTAQKVIARKGASTRRANKADEAEGKLPTHGKVGKARKTAAAKAALAATTQSAAGAAAVATPVEASATTSEAATGGQGAQAAATTTPATTATH